jgi:hypothetical protein
LHINIAIVSSSKYTCNRFSAPPAPLSIPLSHSFISPSVFIPPLNNPTPFSSRVTPWMVNALSSLSLDGIQMEERDEEASIASLNLSGR